MSKRWQSSIRYSMILIKLIMVQLVIKYTDYLSHDMALILMIYTADNAISDILFAWQNLKFVSTVLVALYIAFFKISCVEPAEKIYFGHLVGIIVTQLMAVLYRGCDLFIDFLDRE